MLFRKSVFVLALVSAAVPVAFASSGITYVGGEASVETHAMPVVRTREDVKKELQLVSKNPEKSQSVATRGGEDAAVFPQHNYVYQGGKLVHDDKEIHNPSRASVSMTPTERQALERLYSNY